MINRETLNKLFPIKNVARLPAAAFSEMRVAFTEATAAAAAGSRPAWHEGDASPLAQVLISTSSSEAGAAEPK